MRAWICFGFALPLLASPAQADYVLDQADLPEDFVCNAEWDAARCADESRFEAWHEKYGNIYRHWFSELMFNTNIYFAKTGEGIPPYVERNEDAPEPAYDSLGRETPNLVDVVYSRAFNHYLGWAFAIDEKAMLRMVRRQDMDEVDPKLKDQFKDFLPTTLAATAKATMFEAMWEEADLTKCEGAISHLLNFPAQRPAKLWDEKALEWAPAYEAASKPDYLIITADGDGVSIVARGIRHPIHVDDVGKKYDDLDDPAFVVYNQSNGGEGYHWALRMNEIVQPCLKPSGSMPPWEKVLAANPSAPPTKP